LLSGGALKVADVLVRQGKIERIATSIESPTAQQPEAQVIEAEGLTLLPGVIDPQVHCGEPGLEHKEDLATASWACARGGVTSFLEMPITHPLTTTQAMLADKLARATQKSVVNYGFFLGATAENLSDLNQAEPSCGIQVVMGEIPEATSEALLETIFANGDRLIAVQATDPARVAERRQQFAEATDPAVYSQIQDAQTAVNATRLALKLSEKYQRRLHLLNLSTGAEAEMLRQHKPMWVTAEVTPKLGTLAQLDPPLRSSRDNQALWRALRDGVIDFIATAHTPHTLAEKTQPYPQSPAGMPGVETALPLMLTQAVEGRCTVPEVSQWMSAAVAQAYGILGKGAIAPGYDADLVLVDLNQYRPVIREELLTQCGWSPFEGWNLTGWPVVTIVGGQIAYQNGRVNHDVRGQALSFE
jgi:dihydroorotase